MCRGATTTRDMVAVALAFAARLRWGPSRSEDTRRRCWDGKESREAGKEGGAADMDSRGGCASQFGVSRLGFQEEDVFGMRPTTGFHIVN